MTPSNPTEQAVIKEMLRTIKEETLPDIRLEIREAFNRVDDHFKNVEKKIDKHDDDIEEMRTYVNTQRGSLSLAKWLLSLISISSLLQWIKLLSAK